MADRDLTEKQEKALKERDAVIEKAGATLGDKFTAKDVGDTVKEVMKAQREAEKELSQPDPTPTPKEN